MSYAVSCLTSYSGRSFTNLLERTPPFCHILGKTLHLQELGQGHTYESSKDIALEFLRAYLFASGPGRWKPALFSKVWVDLISYFDPNSTTLEYSLYAPIAFMSGVAQSLKLDDGFEIKRLSVHQVARLATINPTLAGGSGQSSVHSLANTLLRQTPNVQQAGLWCSFHPTGKFLRTLHS